MTEAQLRTLLEEWVKDYCRDQFTDGLPAGVEIFIEEAIKFYTTGAAGISSESLGDYSVSFEKGISGLPTALTGLLHPYRRTGGLKSV